jgi:hypothetical protein
MAPSLRCSNRCEDRPIEGVLTGKDGAEIAADLHAFFRSFEGGKAIRKGNGEERRLF